MGRAFHGVRHAASESKGSRTAQAGAGALGRQWVRWTPGLDCASTDGTLNSRISIHDMKTASDRYSSSRTSTANHATSGAADHIVRSLQRCVRPAKRGDFLPLVLEQ